MATMSATGPTVTTTDAVTSSTAASTSTAARVTSSHKSAKTSGPKKHKTSTRKHKTTSHKKQHPHKTTTHKGKPQPHKTSKQKRQATNVNSACATQPVYQTSQPAAPDPTGFMTDASINNVAKAASAPAGYTWIFANFMRTVNIPGYLGLFQLPTYNVSMCAGFCANNPNSTMFNTYWERDPSVAPADACTNPSAIFSIRCTLWATTVTNTTSQVQNNGEWRSAFPVVVAGSNGYGLTGSKGS